MVQQAFADLGVHPHDVEALSSLPYEEARQRLVLLKDLARKNFRRMALELHPDRTGNDPEKTARFKLLSVIRDDLERVEVRFRSRQVVSPHVYVPKKSTTRVRVHVKYRR
jgi:hypothetical protein